jgi:hypothetical protein
VTLLGETASNAERGPRLSINCRCRTEAPAGQRDHNPPPLRIWLRLGSVRTPQCGPFPPRTPRPWIQHPMLRRPPRNRTYRLRLFVCGMATGAPRLNTCPSHLNILANGQTRHWARPARRCRDGRRRDERGTRPSSPAAAEDGGCASDRLQRTPVNCDSHTLWSARVEKEIVHAHGPGADRPPVLGRRHLGGGTGGRRGVAGAAVGGRVRARSDAQGSHRHLRHVRDRARSAPASSAMATITAPNRTVKPEGPAPSAMPTARTARW